MRVGIHQPMYLPWLGLFDRIQRCDVFVLLDNVPYSKNYFINRNKIKTTNGWTWLTVPVLTSGLFGQLIKDVQIDNKTQWCKTHWRSIYYSYKKAPHFPKYVNFFEGFYAKEWAYLAEANEALLDFVLNTLGIKTRIVKASELDVLGKKEELILNTCKVLKADEYLSGPDGAKYLSLDLWRRNNIKVEFHNYRHPEYPQLYGKFIPQMSIIDLLFNCGEDSLRILSSNQPADDAGKTG
jgi:hypothetical protein